VDALARRLELKRKINDGEPTVGLFIKIASAHVVEMLGSVGIDFVVLDAEHAPFSIDTINNCIMAGRCAGVEVLVRVSSLRSTEIQAVLDMGAAGVVVPHITCADDALNAVGAAKFFGGRRGFSTSHRAADFGSMSMDSFRDYNDRSVIVIGQIEDADTVSSIDTILSVSELDALFIGPVDLSISHGVTDLNNHSVKNSIDKICKACKEADHRLGLFVATLDQVAKHIPEGISLFFVGTDQMLLRNAVSDMVEGFRDKVGC
jgi:2-keto-3-deoxy-L-rhamnonate aldolase RhmA